MQFALYGPECSNEKRGVCGLILLKSKYQSDSLTVLLNIFRSVFTLSVRRDQKPGLSRQFAQPHLQRKWIELIPTMRGKSEGSGSAEDFLHDTLVSLRSQFPTYDRANHLYSQWNRCTALYHHIQALRDKVAALKPTEQIDDDDQKRYNELIHDDIWCGSI